MEREQFLVTYQVISEHPVVGFDDLVRTQLSDTVLMYTRFNKADVWALPQYAGIEDSTIKKKLVFHPGLKSPQVTLEVVGLNLDVIMHTFSTLQRSLKEGILEWARLNPEFIDRFMKSYIRDKRIRKKLNPIYEQLRMIYFRITEEQPMMVDCCEEYVAKKQQDILRRAERDVEELQERIDVLCEQREVAVERVNRLLEEQKRGTEVIRTDDLVACHVQNEKLSSEQEVQGKMNSQRGSDGVWRCRMSPQRQAAHQTGVARPELPVHEEIGGGGSVPWVDNNESTAHGRPVMNSSKRSRSPSWDRDSAAEDEEVRVVRYVDSD